MVRINLLKSVSSKKEKKAKEKTKHGNYGWLVVLFIIIAGTGAGIWYRMHQKAPVVVPPPVAVEQKTDFKPNTHVNPNMVEEVVKEISEERANTKKNDNTVLSYNEMSFAEKINYEVFFSKNVFDSISKIIPGGIGFKTLEIDNFVTVYAVGLGYDSSLVTRMFSQLRAHLGLMPQPYSFIKPNAAKGYKFIATCKPEFGVDLENSFQPIDHLFTREDLNDKLSSFTSIATQNKLQYKSQPVSVNVQKIDDYRRFEFEWQCSGTYKDFVHFVNAVFSTQLPCAFKSIHIKANSSNSVSVAANLIFTIKE